MANEQLSAFWKQVRSDDGLRISVKELERLDSSEEAVTRIVAIARGAGFSFTPEEFADETVHRLGELDDAELESVTGGVMRPTFGTGMLPPPRGIIAILIG